MTTSRLAVTLSLGVLALGLASCTCRPDEPDSPPPVVMGHYAEWDRLVDKAAFADLEGARSIARDLTGGQASRVEAPGAAEGSSTVGAALGMIQTAEDPEELADAVASAAQGCGSCHAAADASVPPPPPWVHPLAAQRAADGLVWSRALPPPLEDDEPFPRLRAAWEAPMPEDTGFRPDPDVVRVSRVLMACVGCHGEGSE